MANTRKMLAIVPDDKLDYAPHDKSMKMGRVVELVIGNDR